MLGPSLDHYDGCYCCCQFYLNRNLTLRLKIAKNPFFIHSPLDLNLAKDENEYMVNKLEKLLDQIYKHPASIVLHVGKLGTIDNVCERLNQINILPSKLGKSLLLENAAGQGTELGRKSFELRRIFEKLDNSKNIGICLDTQHAFAGGLSSFTNHYSVMKLIEKIESFTSLGLVHLNDSKTDYHSRVDRHAPLGEGKIWSDNTESLVSLLDYCQEKGIFMVSETRKYEQDKKFIEKLKR